MVTETNHHENKQRIVEILKDDNTIYSGTESDDKLRDIIVGIPDGGDERSDFLNYAYVTNGRPFESINNKRGSRRPDGSYTILEHHVRYDIVFIIDQKNAQDAEKLLDVLHNRINKRLEENPQLKSTGNVPDDPKCDTSHPERIDPYKPELYKGGSKQGRVITLYCEISTGT